ncbi:MAG: hypothetical protein RIG77_07820 [Cyclobacteriaceae bacterium]
MSARMYLINEIRPVSTRVKGDGVVDYRNLDTAFLIDFDPITEV